MVYKNGGTKQKKQERHANKTEGERDLDEHRLKAGQVNEAEVQPVCVIKDNRGPGCEVRV